MIRASERLCRVAGVPRVTPHGLRGSGATTDVLDEVVKRISQRLGHANTGVTLDHYLDADTIAVLSRALRTEAWDRSHEGPTSMEQDAKEQKAS
jgi:integrase